MAGHNCHSTTGGGDRVTSAAPVQAMAKDPSAGHEASISSAPSPSGVGLSLENLDQMLPYDGLRNTVRRSQFAKTGLLVGRTEEDQGRPRPIGFESSLERAVAISCLLHPQTVGLKCQPLTVYFDPPVSGTRSHTLDYLLSQRCGTQTFIFVKNEEALGRPKIEALTRAIRMALPEGFRFAVISEASFPPVVRGNNERMFLAKRVCDQQADARLTEVLEDLRDTDCFTVEELVIRCDLGPRNTDKGRAFDAVLRAIAAKTISAPRLETIDYPTVLRWPE